MCELLPEARRPLHSGPMSVSVDTPAASHPPQTRVPDFFIVGHGKSGTTALWDMLRRHPQLYMPSSKEPWFFADELQPLAALRPSGTGKTPHTLEEYLSLFDGAMPQQQVGEASSLYLWSHTAAGRIAQVQPAARIIAVLREPASFLRSLHLQFVQVYIESEQDLGKAIALEDARRKGRHAMPHNEYWPRATLYSEHVRYAEQLRRYHDRFGPEQVLVLIYDDFRRNNEATVRRVWRFLEVDDTHPVLVGEANPTVRVRSPRLYATIHALATGDAPASRAVQAAAKALAPRGLSRESAMAIRDRVVYGAPRPADAGLMLELRRRFKGEVVALSEYLDRDLVTLWGYDTII
jgi:Sulfotransferase family